MAELNLKQITDKLNSEFASDIRKLVFWYDANAEFVAEIIRIFDQAGVFWQMGELGKVDEGGGGTIAYILANLGAEVVDCGTGLMGMHSLYELSSKADLYSTYAGYQAFLISQ